jgi:hypothetical protein
MDHPDGRMLPSPLRNDLTAEREEVEATLDVANATSEFVEPITALRSTVAGEINSAERIAATQASLRRVFDGFVLHRASAPEAPRRANAELMVNVPYVLEPLVAEDTRLGTMAAGTPLLTALRSRWRVGVPVRDRHAHRLHPPSCSPRSRWPSTADPTPTRAFVGAIGLASRCRAASKPIETLALDDERR